MLGMFPEMGSAVQGFKAKIQNMNVLKDNNVIPHVASILGHVDKIKKVADIGHVSNLVKQSKGLEKGCHFRTAEMQVPLVKVPCEKRESYVHKFSSHHQKLKWAGINLPLEEVYLIDKHLSMIAELKKAEEVRFWGKVMGTNNDYYVIQGRTTTDGGLEDIPQGAQKRGQGVNYYTFWVNNNLLNDQWAQLPLITPQHVKNARKIKKNFSGQLFNPILSHPAFGKEQLYYLKAQLVRMTSSLQLVPKGIYKPHDENPKVIEFEDEPKVPQFAELTSIQTWTHRNPNLLNLGRYTHYIDPNTPEDQLETVTAELAEKDPEIQRLRGITEDKLPEGNPLGVENVWLTKAIGDSQIFQKEEASCVYAVSVIKNILWPGWVTIGYKGGFCNFYLGYGHKWTQPSWCEYQNGNLGQEAQDVEDFHEPNPAQLPKPVEEAPADPPAQQD